MYLHPEFDTGNVCGFIFKNTVSKFLIVLCNYLELDHVTGDQFADDLEDERYYGSAERSGLVLQ